MKRCYNQHKTSNATKHICYLSRGRKNTSNEVPSINASNIQSIKKKITDKMNDKCMFLFHAINKEQYSVDNTHSIK